MAKPDDRSDNVEKLQNNVQNTIENYREAKEYLDEHADEISGAERSQLEAKNERRKTSIRGFRKEIQDEADSNRSE